MSQLAGNLVEAHEFDASDLVQSPLVRSQQIAGLAQERRAAERRSIEVHATITIPEESTLLEGQTVDLSVGGASITMPFELARGRTCLIDLEFEACGSSSTFRIPAEVRYCVKMDGGEFRAGVRFGHIDEATAAFLAAILTT